MRIRLAITGPEVEEYGVRANSGARVRAVLVMIQFWQLYVPNVRESSTVGKGLPTSLHKSIDSQKEKDVVGQLSVAFQNLFCVSVSTKL